MTFPVAPGDLSDQREPWEKRLREASYTSPGGTTVRFAYEDVERSYELRGTAYEFSGVNDAYVQRRGFGSRRYPVRAIFWGKEHDLESTAFEAAILEEGLGTLEHPRYGTLTVVPFGDVTRRDDLKTASNQSIVEVTFWTTLRGVYPRAEADPKNEILAAIAGFNVAAAQDFESMTDLTSAVDKANIKVAIRKLLNDVGAVFITLSDGVSSISRELQDWQSLINQGLDVFVGLPLQLAQQTLNLISLPSRIVEGISDRLRGYREFADRMMASTDGRPGYVLQTTPPLRSRTQRVANAFHATDLAALGAVSGSVGACLRHTFATKTEAIAAAEEVLSQLDAVVTWRDGAFGDLASVGLDQVDGGGAIQALQRAVDLTVGHLVQVSFDLEPERRIVIDRDRTIIDLASQLYGVVDERLNSLIDHNGLSGSEILEVPRGRVIVYYGSG